MNSFDDKTYWINRHQKYCGDLRSVGVKSYHINANTLKYQMVRERYRCILSKLTLHAKSQILDVGAGTGEFIDLFLNDKRVSQIIATDISPIALEQLKQKHPSVQILTKSIADIKLPDKSMELIHCFDVLYHIVNDDEWKQSVDNLCRIALKFVIIHGEIANNPRLVSARHVKSRPFYLLNEIMLKNGFLKKYIVPTHLLSHKPFIYKINGLFPKVFYLFDNFCATRFPNLAQRIASYAIIVYERKDL
ncbi:MAG: hypothetical protein US76_01080 [Parcubacteria group bacterium GW2011_GWA2_38_13b]|nr:MAG: hypothetical protein US76_01080 [Parcubacteria group bacterium GW2011_GWA2_38_13b]